MFERFHRGRAGRSGPPGTGLGLPIARELAGEWDATVALEAACPAAAGAPSSASPPSAQPVAPACPWSARR